MPMTPVEQWTQYLREDRGASPRTVEAYLAVLRSLGHDPVTATGPNVEAWWRSKAHLAPASRQAYLSSLRSFYRWARAWDVRSDDPTARLVTPKVKQRIPRPAPEVGLRRLLETFPDGELRRVTVLGAFAGLRISESAALDWSDVRDDAVVVRDTKGGKSRVVPIDPEVVALLGGRQSGNILTAGGIPSSTKALGQRFTRAARAAGVDITSHQLRHRFGTEAYRTTNGDILAVRDIMGHADVNTTAGYAQAATETGRRIAAGVMLR